MLKTLIFIIAFIPMFMPVSACWTEQNRQAILSDARRLMPQNFQWVLTRYEAEFQEGYSSWKPQASQVDSQVSLIVEDCDAAIKAYTSEMSYPKGTRLLGKIARQITEFHTLLADSARLKNPSWPIDYAIFLEKNRQYFRIRWKGFDERPKSRAALTELIMFTLKKKDKLDLILQDTLNKENKMISEFDLMSAPFGAGSITYSSAVTTIAFSWLYVWDHAGGIKPPSHPPER